MIFDETSNCENLQCNEPYNVQMKFLFNESISNDVNFIKFKCDKCQMEQYIWVKSVYDNGLGKGFNINFRLISPIALLKRKWFQDQLDLDISFISKEHIEPYMSAMFYFYLQGIYCGFMIPPRKKNIQYQIEHKDIYNVEINKNNKANTGTSGANAINNNEDKKKPEKIEKKEIVNNNMGKAELKSTKSIDDNNKNYILVKSVSQNYLKTLKKKKTFVINNYNTQSRNVIFSRNNNTINYDNKFKNSVDLERDAVDLDISGDNKGLFEYKSNSKDKKKKKNPFKKKAPIISLNSRILKKNPSGYLNTSRNNEEYSLSSQNSFEFFKIKKK